MPDSYWLKLPRWPAYTLSGMPLKLNFDCASESPLHLGVCLAHRPVGGASRHLVPVSSILIPVGRLLFSGRREPQPSCHVLQSESGVSAGDALPGVSHSAAGYFRPSSGTLHFQVPLDGGNQTARKEAGSDPFIIPSSSPPYTDRITEEGHTAERVWSQ